MSSFVLNELITASTEAYPDGLAVSGRERTLTYGELEVRSNQVAHLLLELGTQKGDRVGLYLDKSLESIVGIHGTLKAGAAYVPLDPNAPVRRLQYMVRNCGMRLLLSAMSKAEVWPELLKDSSVEAVLVLDSEADDRSLSVKVMGQNAIESQPSSPPDVRVVEGDLAYILYTSGSTGDPKGVMLSHRNALTFVEWAADVLSVGPDDRLSNHAPHHFDLSVFDIFAAARSGAAVVLVPTEGSVLPMELGKFIEEERISIWYSVPSVLTMLVMRGALGRLSLSHLRAVVFAGEVFPTKHLRSLMSLLPHCEFHNWYGPTETNVCTAYRVVSPPEEESEPVPIGKAILNTEVFALTDDGRLCRAAEIGELHVGGPGVMQGYWADPERTSRSLIPNPIGTEKTDIVYRTGDLVRQDQDGNWRFLGRRDAQIKSRGYRIELGEIEAVLSAHPEVVECAVIAVPDELVTNRIKAYVVPEGGHVARAELVRHCVERLPRYMIPETFEFLDALPKISTGKIDRRILAAFQRSTLPTPSARA